MFKLHEEMSERYISSIHIEKLGHYIPEIRERALRNIVSKLDNGCVYDNDLARSKEILKKLFDWFLFDNCSNEETVLRLIKRILESESGKTLIIHYGLEFILPELNKLRKYVEGKYHRQIESIVELIDVPIVPPLESKEPLSYRSDASQENVRIVQSTATPIEGFISQYNSPEQEVGLNDVEVDACYTESPKSDNNSEVIVRCKMPLPFYTLPFQALVRSDRNVMDKVLEQLQKRRGSSAVYEPCWFFFKSILRDYPAEVLLQRPWIVEMLYDLLHDCMSPKIVEIVLRCLLRLTKLLRIRINHYNDPSMHNYKQILLPRRNSCVSDQRFSRYSELSLSSDDTESIESVESLTNHQLSLPGYCFSTILSVLYILRTRSDWQACVNVAFELLKELENVLALCVRKAFWSEDMRVEIHRKVYKGFQDLFCDFADVLEYYRVEVVSKDNDPQKNGLYIRLIYICAQMLGDLVPPSVCEKVLPNNLKEALGHVLMNPIFFKLHPEMHQTLFEYCKEFDPGHRIVSLRKFGEVLRVCDSMTSFIRFLNAEESGSACEKVRLARDSLLSLEFHKSARFVPLFFDLASKFHPVLAEEMKEVVLKLLSHKLLEIRKESYRLCHLKVAEVANRKSNTNRYNVSESKLHFLLHPDVFYEIVSFGLLKAEDHEITTFAGNILVDFLKCKTLVSDETWLKIIAALVPSLPILLTCANKSSSIGRTLLGFIDPDNAMEVPLPALETMKANVEMLFSKEQSVRMEAVNRLCWLLSLQPNVVNLLPRLGTCQKSLLGTSCETKFARDLNRRRTEHFYQPSELHRVLDMLRIPNLEPSIIQSALTQISVMTEDHFLHEIFLINNGLGLLQKFMSTALVKDDHSVYPDSIIPAIGILKNICFYNATIRQELANDEKLFANVLRGLFNFCADERLKQDASSLLFLLIFNVHLRGSPANGNFSVHQFAAKYLNVPFISEIHAVESQHCYPGLRDFLFADKFCSDAIRIHWTIEWYGGLENVLNSNVANFSRDNVEGCDDVLKMSSYRLVLLKNSATEHRILKCLYDVQNGTDPSGVLEAVEQLIWYMQLVNLISPKDKEHVDPLLKLPWENTFKRYFTISPSRDTIDIKLVTGVINLLCLLVSLYKFSDNPCWVNSYLKNARQSWADLLRRENGRTEEKEACIESLLELIKLCAGEEHHSSNYGASFNDVQASSGTWRGIVEIIIENLGNWEDQNFYDLVNPGFLDDQLSALVHLTGSLGWSRERFPAPRNIFSNAVSTLCELIRNFRKDESPAAGQSLLAVSITRHVLLALNNLFAEMQYVGEFKNWEVMLLDEDLSGSSLKDFMDLRHCRDVVVRAAVMQMFATLCLNESLAAYFINYCRTEDQGVWEIILAILLDSDEACIVRENAAALLSNLSVYLIGSSNKDRGEYVDDSERVSEDKGVVLGILDVNNFWGELEKILSSLFTKSVFIPRQGQHNELDYAHSINSNFDAVKSLNYYLNSRTEPVVVATPGLIKSLAGLMQNLLMVSPDEVSTILLETSLLKLLFRCLRNPTMEIKHTKDMTMYCEILEMDTALCRTLNLVVRKSQGCFREVLQTKDCLCVMFSLLNGKCYYTHLKHLIYMRNRLWTEVFQLVKTLLETSASIDSLSDHYEDAYSVLSGTLIACDAKPFVQSLCEAMASDEYKGLQESAISSFTSLLRTETGSSTESSSSLSNDPSNPSLQNVLDNVGTPRLHSVRSEDTVEGSSTKRRVSESFIAEKICFGHLKKPVWRRVNRKGSSDEFPMSGTEICKILMDLYDAYSLKKERKSCKMWHFINSGLASVLCVSQEAKWCAFNNNFLYLLLDKLYKMNYKLSMQSVDKYRRLEKKVSLFNELDYLVGLFTNFMAGCDDVKRIAAYYCLADYVHKLWVWFALNKSILVNLLKMLCTFTTNCSEACETLTLTSSSIGIPVRKVPSGDSLLTVLVRLASKEMELVSKTHSLTVLKLCFEILQNACCVPECRAILYKSHILDNLGRLYVASRKKQMPWDQVELLWLEFLETYTGHSGGQSHVGKSVDALELIVSLTSSTKPSTKLAALLVLRNMTFCNANRSRFLASSNFLNILNRKLSEGSLEEKNAVVVMMWSLIANYQKGRVILKNARLDCVLHRTLKTYRLLDDRSVPTEDVERMQFVLDLLRESDRNR